MQKIFLIILAIAVASFMSMGCMTIKVLEKDTPEFKKEVSQEEVKMFLLTREYGDLVVYTDKYMYIIQANSQISFLINNIKSKYVSIDFKNGDYWVNEKNDINIALDGYVDNSADEELKKLAMDTYAFYQTSTNKYKIHMNLHGKRYALDDYTIGNYSQTKTKPHNALILNMTNTTTIYHNSSADTMRKVALLPLSVPADAVAIGVGASVAAVAVPLYLLSK